MSPPTPNSPNTKKIQIWWGSMPSQYIAMCKAAWAKKSDNWIEQFEKDVRLCYQVWRSETCAPNWGEIVSTRLMSDSSPVTNVPRPNPNTFLHIVATDARLKDLKFHLQFAWSNFFWDILVAQYLDTVYVNMKMKNTPLLELTSVLPLPQKWLLASYLMILQHK